MTALIVIASILTYIVTGSAIGGTIWNRTATPAEELRHGVDNFDAGIKAFFGGLLWPVLLPITAGLWLSSAPKRKHERAAETQKRINQLETELGMEERKGKRNGYKYDYRDLV